MTTTIKERPILFSAPMVQAILAGRKAQTRRIIKGAPLAPTAYLLGVHQGVWGIHESVERDDGVWRGKCPYGVPGDRLWVRESIYVDWHPWDTERLPKERPDDIPDDCIYYRADGDCCQQIPECECGSVCKPRWRHSIHMPRWASRITLEITDVRVQRVMEMTSADVVAEGFPFGSDLDQFKQLWTTINGAESWAANPWVWVIDFRRIET